MDKRILKAYERYDYNGRVVPGSLVLRYKKPKNGKWKELTGYECCNTTTTTTTAAPSLRMSVSTLLPDSSFSFYIAANASGPMNFSINYGDGNPLSPINISAGSNTVVTHTFLAPNDYQIELIFSDGSNVNIDTFTIDSISILTGITNLDLFSNARVLEIVSCENLDILEIPAMPNLINLFLTGCTNLSVNLFETLPVGSLPVLSSVYCQNTSISNINVLAAPDLYVLYSSNAQIGDPVNVDNIFNNIRANDRTGGVIDLSGGTNAIPTGASLVARTELASLAYDYYLNYNKGLVMTFDGAFPVASPTLVSSWNTFFGTSVFANVAIDGFKVTLTGSGTFTLGSGKMLNKNLISFDDTAGYITSTTGTYSFASNALLNFVNLAGCTSIAGTSAYTFMGSGSSATSVTLSFPVCLSLGGTVGNNAIFSSSFSGLPITLIVSASRMFCNSGAPDGDIQELQSSNTVTVVTN